MRDIALTLNAGSSSLKFAVFDLADLNRCLLRRNLPLATDGGDPGAAIERALATVSLALAAIPASHLSVIGHRVVHGGRHFNRPTLLDAENLPLLENLCPLAPLHLAPELQVIRLAQQQFPQVPAIACFDTAFHRHQPRLAQLFGLPRSLIDEGIIRYGFHGLSYEFIATAMTDLLPPEHRRRVVVAHLGNGASLCALKAGQSVATTMGFTTLDGLMMGTRCGALDPGVVLYLAQQKQMSLDSIHQLLYRESGLLGVSGSSHDMAELERTHTAEADEARALFAYRVAREIGSLAIALEGLDAVIFTGGIGQHSHRTRAAIVERLTLFGATLDDAANVAQGPSLHAGHSDLGLYVIPTDEELMIARHCAGVLGT